MDFTDILDEQNIDYRQSGEHHHATINWIQFDCPFCSPNSNRFRMGYSIERKFCNCWMCGIHSTYSVLIELDYDPKKVSKAIQDLRIWPHKSKERMPEDRRFEFPSGVCDVTLIRMAANYLKQRKIDDRTRRLYQLKATGAYSSHPWRIIIPIMFRGETVSWTSRSISDKTRSKYITAKRNQEKIHHKQLLFGEDFCRHTIVVCEGPFDAMVIGPGATATLGTVVTTAQLKHIKKYPKRIICFDSEFDAQKRALKLLNDLSVFRGETHNIVLDSKDPASATKKELNQIRKLIH